MKDILLYRFLNNNNNNKKKTREQKSAQLAQKNPRKTAF